MVGPSLENPARETWSSGRHFTMACISFAVGMGNIWRFPSLVYEHNGGAFLIPYFACSFIIGFPMLYLELSLGQFTRMGPAVVYGWIRPYAQGIGWVMVSMSLLVCIYYNMIVAWTLFYLFKIITGGTYQWSSCVNEFNTPYCSSSLEDMRCSNQLSLPSNPTHNYSSQDTSSAFFFNGSCYLKSNTQMLDFKQAFSITHLQNYVLERTPTIDSFGGLNPKLVIAYLFAWMTTAVVLCKGVKLMGKVAYFTSTVPYLIIIALFVRSVTLDGAIEGMNYYILKPDFSTVWDLSAWRAAATHVSFSLSIGFGGILSLASYNPKEHNCYKDALIITSADAAMSLFGGTAVFSVLGFISKQLNLPIDQVVQSGTGLAFVAYPEALSRMPISWLWALLFFFMIWTLGVSSQFGYAECICTAFCDQFEVLRRNQAKTVFGVCACLYLCGLIMCTRSGIFYFNIFNDYSSSFALTFILFLESILICYIYGYKNYLADLRSMVGPPLTKLGAIFGPTGLYISFVLRFICPLQAFVMFIFALVTQINYDMSYGKGSRLYVFPKWSIMLGWTLSLLPLLWLPVFFVYRACAFRQANKIHNQHEKLFKNTQKHRSTVESFKETFCLQSDWPSYAERSQKQVDSSDFSFVPRGRSQKVYEVEHGFSNGFSLVDTTHAFTEKT